MDHLRRLGFAFFMFASMVAMFAPRLARAVNYEYTAKVTDMTSSVAKVSTTKYSHLLGPEPTVLYDSGSEACNSAVARGGVLLGTQSRFHSYVHPNCKYEALIWGSWDLSTVTIYTSTTQACPTGSTEISGVCRPLVCPTGGWQEDPGNTSQCRRELNCAWPQKFVVQSGTCECDSGTAWAVPEGGGLATPVHGVATVPWTTSDMTNKPTTGCASSTGAAGEGGCTFTADAWGWNGSRLQVEGDTFTGAKCTVGGTGSLEGTKTCPVGQVAGTINGQTVCVEGGKTEVVKPPKTETTVKTNPDGSTDTTTTTTTEVTKCDGGNCTTTITTSSTTVHKDAQGNTTGTETQTGSTTTPGTGSGGNGDGEGTSSSFGGACPSFSCEGDAVQCAIALEQHKRNCELFGDLGGLTREAAVEAFDQARTFDADQLTTEGTLAGVSSSTFLGGGCLADAVYTIKGETITIPFSSLCVYIQAAGLAFLAVCGLISFGIVSRGVTA